MFKAEYVFVRILIPFILGIGFFYPFPNRTYLLFAGITFCLILTGILTANLTYKRLNFYHHKGFIGIFFILLFFNLGAFICLLNNERINRNYFANQHYRQLKLWVNDEPQQHRTILRFKAQVTAGYSDGNQTKTSGQLLVALKTDNLKPIRLKYSDEIIIAAHYTEIEPPYNPAEFDFKAWLGTQNIYHQTFPICTILFVVKSASQ